MKHWHIAALAGFVSLIVSIGISVIAPVNRTPAAGTTPDSYSRILSSKTIQCGYVVAPPYTIKDPNSGKLSGLGVDTIESAAKQVGYKLVWAEEVTWATMIEGLRTGRYDMVCSGVWINGARGQHADFTIPLFYNVVNAYVRADDNRFDTNLPLEARYASINRPDLTIATIDGEITAIIADQSFPQARRYSLPQNVDVSQLLLSVVDRKADITFMEPYFAAQFLKSHPGTLRDISRDRPLRIYPWSYMVPKGDYALRDLLNAMLLEVIDSGQMDQLIAKYDIEPGTIYPLAYPYREPVRPAAR